MRPIKLFIASSLDGYIARSSGAVDWLFTDQDYGYTAFFEQIDTVIMGRKTYEQVLSFGDYPYSSKKSFVISKTLTDSGNPDVEIVREPLTQFVETLRRSPGQAIWLVGGAALIHSFIQQRCLDQLILAIHPTLLGNGIPLFIENSQWEINLQLTQVKTYESGLLQVSYEFGDYVQQPATR